jgi:Domain of Unknown Function (DUF1206)
MSAGDTMSGAAARVVDATKAGADSRPVDWAARLGLTARAVVYLLLGVLALLVARGARAEVDQKGVLEQIIARPYGGAVVAVLAAGFACYSLWRLSEAAFGVTGEKPGPGPRIKSLARGLVYGFLAITAVALLFGANSSQATQQKTLTAQVMAHPGGRWVVGIAGAVVVVVGLTLVVEGLRLTFMRYFPAGSMSPGLRSAIRQLGRIGTVARGLVFALAGALVVSAAWTYQPAKAGGLDAALKTLRGQDYGPVLLGVAGIGLIIFGLYGLAEARYRRV